MSFQTLRWSPNKSLQHLCSEIEAAHFARCRELELDEKILLLDDFSEVHKMIQKHQLHWSVRTQTENVPAILKRLEKYEDFHRLNIFFKKKEHLNLLADKNLPLQRFRLISEVKTTTDFFETLGDFKNCDNLYFNFQSYNPNDTECLTTQEVQKLLFSVKKQGLSEKIRAYPFSSLSNDDQEELGEIGAFRISADFTYAHSNQKHPLVSIVIPTYNSKYFLLNVVKHLAALKDIPFEVIIVDDGGTDDSGGFLNSYLRSEDIQINLKYLYWPKPQIRPDDFFRAGLCRNLGARHARGEYLVFLDSDILVPPNFLSDVQKNLQQHDVIQYVRRHILPEKSNSHVKRDNLSPQDLYIEDEAYWGPFFSTNNWKDLPFFWKYTCTYCLAISSKNFFELGQFNRHFISYGFEDTDLGYRLHKNNLKFFLSHLETLHLTKAPGPNESPSFMAYKRHQALTKTAKIFFLLNLDAEIYKHFIVFMSKEYPIRRWVQKIKRLFKD